MSNKKRLFISQVRELIGENFCFLPDVIPLRHLPDEFSMIENACRNINLDYSISGLGVRHALNPVFAEVDEQLIQTFPATATMPDEYAEHSGTLLSLGSFTARG